MSDLQEREPGFDFAPIRRSAVNNAPFDRKFTVRYLTALAETEAVESDPETFNKQFDERYEVAVGELLSRPDVGEKRYRLSRDIGGQLVRTEITVDTTQDKDQMVSDLFDALDQAKAPILRVMEEAQAQGVLHGEEYGTAMRLCLLIAAQNYLPPSQQ